MEWKPRRSSLKLSTEPITDDSVVDRPSTRRVSFARVISICGGEQSETQLSLGGSDEFTEVTKPCESLSTIRDIPMDETSDLSMTIDGNMCVAKPISSNDFNSVALLPRLEETWIMSPSTMNESAVTAFPSSPGGPLLLSTRNTCVNEKSGSISVSASDDMSVDEQQLSDVTLPDSHTPIKVKGTVTTSDDVNTPSMSPSTPYVCSETKRGDLMCFSNGPQCQSLPPLQRHPNLSIAGMSVLSTSKLCSTESKRHGCALSNKSGARDGNKLLTESLATTPLRQVIPRDWIHAVQLSVSRSTCGTFSRRLDPNHLIPSEKCRRSHLLSVSDHPCYTSPPRGFGLTTKSLEEFLERHHCVLLDEEDVLEPTFPGNLDALKQFQPELYVEFSKKREAIRQIFDANIKHYINEWKLRRSGVLFSHSPSLPVVEQLSKMTDSQVEEFFAQALERLNQCEIIAKHGYCELKRQSMVEYRLEQEWEHDRLAQVDLKLDAELCTLEQELSRLDTDLRSMQDMEKYWKETAKRLDVIEHESQEVLLQTQKLLVDTAELDADFRKRLLSAPKIVRTSHVLVGANVVGATELFSPWNTPMVAGRAGQNKDKTIASDIDLSNLLTVCAVNCLSFESQTYCLRTLFGLVWFKVACDPIQSVKEKMTQSVSTIMPLDCLVVTEVECCAPPEDSGPVDCNAVEALAAYTVEFFQSRDGRSQLRSRLVGSTLESVVKNLEFIMSPYLLLGADLRAIYVAQHEVEFNAVLPMDFTLLASTQKNLVRCTPTHLILNEHGQGKMNTSLNGSSLDRIIPSGSINVSVTVFNREVHAVVVLQFKLSSLDVDVSNCPATCLDVILGRIDHRSVQQLLDTCKVAPGCLHHAVKVVNEALPSMRKVRCET